MKMLQYNCIILDGERGGKNISKLKKAISFILNVIIVLEIIFILIFTVPKLLGFKTFVVTSGSMQSIYPVGSLIFVKNIEPNDVKINDTITFYMNNNSIIATHQIYEIDEENEEFKTQGIDNKDDQGNIIHDAQPVKFSSLIGKTVFCIKNIGFINRLITKPPGIYVIFTFTVIIIIIYYILDRKLEVNFYEKQKNRK